MEDIRTSPEQPTKKTRRKATSKPSRHPAASREACRCVIPDGVPSLKSFSHIRNPKERRAKEYEQHLLTLRDLFPEYGAGIEEQLAYARSQAGRNSIGDRDRVTQVLEQWRDGMTAGEVADDLGIPYATAYKILKAFAESGFVEVFTRKSLAGNKPLAYFKLSH